MNLELINMIVIASDHAGFPLKEGLKKFLEERGIAYQDLGTSDQSSVDYPDYAQGVAKMITNNEVERGILICGSGLGMSIAANRYSGVRATLCHDIFSARMSRAHNDSNVLVLAGRMISPYLAKEILDVWLATDFEGGRHQKRIEKIDK